MSDSFMDTSTANAYDLLVSIFSFSSLIFHKIMFDKLAYSRYNSKVRLRGGVKYAAGTWKDY